jgi:uncharacterized protein
MLLECFNINKRKLNMSILDLLLPRETKFFDYMTKHVDYLVQGATSFQDLVYQIETLSPEDFASRAASIHKCESDMDKMEAQILEQLHLTLITPIDREDIMNLTMIVDQSMDSINAITRRLAIYKQRALTEDIKKFSTIIHSIALQLRESLQLFITKKGIKESVVRMHELENEADLLFHHAVAKLFDGSTANIIDVIKYKELYEMLENTVDTIDHAGKLIRAIKVKQG